MAESNERYCRECGYSLAGLNAGTCPECGQAFDPLNPDTYVEDPKQARAPSGLGGLRPPDLPVPNRTVDLLSRVGILVGMFVIPAVLYHQVPEMWLILMVVMPVWLLIGVWVALTSFPEEHMGGVMMWMPIGLTAGLVLGVAFGPCGVAFGMAIGLIAGLLRSHQVD